MRKHIHCIALLGCYLLSPLTLAEEMGLYAGGGIGQASLGFSGNDFGQRFDDIRLDDNAFAWKAWAGLQLLPVIGLEVSYHRFGSVDDASPAQQAALDADTVALFARGIMPLGPLHLFAKVGYHFYDTEASLEVADEALRLGERQEGQELAFGAGAGVDLGDLTLRAEYELFLADGIDDLNMISLGVSYSF